MNTELLSSADLIDAASVDNTTGVAQASYKPTKKEMREMAQQQVDAEYDAQNPFSDENARSIERLSRDYAGDTAFEGWDKGGDNDYLANMSNIDMMTPGEMDNNVGERQTISGKIGNSIVNNISLAGTTFLSNLFAFPAGVIEAAGTGSTDPNIFWNNALTNTLDEFTSWEQRQHGLYQTDAFRNASIAGKIQHHTSQFIADLIQNLGFTEGGVAAAMVPGLGIAGKAGQVAQAVTKSAKIARAVAVGIRGLESAYGEAAVESIGAKNDQIKFAKEKLFDAYHKQVALYGESSPQAEAALNNYRAQMANVEQEAIDQGNFVFGANMLILTATNAFQFEHLFGRGFDTARRASTTANRAAALGAVRGEQNVPLDAAMKALPKYMQTAITRDSRGLLKLENSCRDMMKSLERDVKKLEKLKKAGGSDAKLEANINAQKSLLKKYTDAAYSLAYQLKVDPFTTVSKSRAILQGLTMTQAKATSEGFEEVTQNWAQGVARHNVAWNQNRVKGMLDINGIDDPGYIDENGERHYLSPQGKATEDYGLPFDFGFQNEYAGAVETYSAKEQLIGLLNAFNTNEWWNKHVAYEGAMGFATGLIGLPSFHGKKFSWEGGLAGTMIETLSKQKKAQQYCDAINARLRDDKKFKAFATNFIRHIAYEDIKTAAAQAQDRKSWNDALFSQLFGDVEAFSEAGNLKLLEEVYAEGTDNLTSEQIKQMIEETTKTDERGQKQGPWINNDGTVMDESQIRQKIEEKRERMRNLIKEYSKDLEEVQEEHPELSDENVRSVAYLKAMIRDKRARLKSLFADYSADKGHMASIFTRAAQLLANADVIGASGRPSSQVRTRLAEEENEGQKQARSDAFSRFIDLLTETMEASTSAEDKASLMKLIKEETERAEKDSPAPSIFNSLYEGTQFLLQNVLEGEWDSLAKAYNEELQRTYKTIKEKFPEASHEQLCTLASAVVDDKISREMSALELVLSTQDPKGMLFDGYESIEPARMLSDIRDYLSIYGDMIQADKEIRNIYADPTGALRAQQESIRKKAEEEKKKQNEKLTVINDETQKAFNEQLLAAKDDLSKIFDLARENSILFNRALSDKAIKDTELAEKLNAVKKFMALKSFFLSSFKTLLYNPHYKELFSDSERAGLIKLAEEIAKDSNLKTLDQFYNEVMDDALEADVDEIIEDDSKKSEAYPIFRAALQDALNESELSSSVKPINVKSMMSNKAYEAYSRARASAASKKKRGSSSNVTTVAEAEEEEEEEEEEEDGSFEIRTVKSQGKSVKTYIVKEKTEEFKQGQIYVKFDPSTGTCEEVYVCAGTDPTSGSVDSSIVCKANLETGNIDSENIEPVDPTDIYYPLYTERTLPDAYRQKISSGKSKGKKTTSTKAGGATSTKSGSTKSKNGKAAPASSETNETLDNMESVNKNHGKEESNNAENDISEDSVKDLEKSRRPTSKAAKPYICPGCDEKARLSAFDEGNGKIRIGNHFVDMDKHLPGYAGLYAIMKKYGMTGEQHSEALRQLAEMQKGIPVKAVFFSIKGVKNEYKKADGIEVEESPIFMGYFNESGELVPVAPIRMFDSKGDCVVSDKDFATAAQTPKSTSEVTMQGATAKTSITIMEAESEFSEVYNGQLNLNTEKVDGEVTYKDKETGKTPKNAVRARKNSMSLEEASRTSNHIDSANRKNNPVAYIDRSGGLHVFGNITQQEKASINISDANKIPGQVFLLVKGADNKYRLVALSAKQLPGSSSVAGDIKNLDATPDIKNSLNDKVEAVKAAAKTGDLKSVHQAMRVLNDALDEVFAMRNINFSVKKAGDKVVVEFSRPAFLKSGEIAKDSKGNVRTYKTVSSVEVSDATTVDDVLKALGDQNVRYRINITEDGLATEQANGQQAFDMLTTDVNMEHPFANGFVVAKPAKKVGDKWEVDNKAWEADNPHLNVEAENKARAKRKAIEAEATIEEKRAALDEKFGKPIHLPTLSGTKTLYVGFEKGKLVAYNAKTGAIEKLNTAQVLQAYMMTQICRGVNIRRRAKTSGKIFFKNSMVWSNDLNKNVNYIWMDHIEMSKEEAESAVKAGLAHYLTVDYKKGSKPVFKNTGGNGPMTIRVYKTKKGEYKFYGSLRVASVNSEVMSEYNLLTAGLKKKKPTEYSSMSNDNPGLIDLNSGFPLTDSQSKQIQELMKPAAKGEGYLGPKIKSNKANDGGVYSSVTENFKQVGVPLPSYMSTVETNPGDEIEEFMLASERDGAIDVNILFFNPTTVEEEVNGAAEQQSEDDSNTNSTTKTGDDIILKGLENNSSEETNDGATGGTAVEENNNQSVAPTNIDTNVSTETHTADNVADAVAAMLEGLDSFGNDGRVGDDFRLRSADEELSETWNQEEELSKLNKMLPQLTRDGMIDIVDGLINVPGRGRAWGTYRQAHITLSNIAAPGTAYHEAFHLVFDTYLTAAERAKCFEEARQKFPNLTNDELEEEMAEGFREYVMTNGKTTWFGRVKAFFRKLFAKITHQNVTESYIDSVYAAIRDGRYAIKTAEENKIYTNLNAVDSSKVDVEIHEKPLKEDPTRSNITARVYIKGNHNKGYFELVKDAETDMYSVHFKTSKPGAKHNFAAATEMTTKEDRKTLFEELVKLIPTGGMVSTWGVISEDGIRGLNNVGRDMIKVGEREVHMEGTKEAVNIPIFKKIAITEQQKTMDRRYRNLDTIARQYLESTGITAERFEQLSEDVKKQILKCL